MKYGRNQWARISSLLVRKTPKQCKARWNEWLDPRIKKTEWSKEEDEKLLHLSKVFPSQWGTVSDLVGRTAQMCLERYERLLDAAQEDQSGSHGEGNVSSSLAEARKLRPGEIDPSPETKAARPDPVDMDEDEKEMLAEARARLANTQGKKAKRKARERLLDEARRLAALQKRRELATAGLPGVFTKRKGMNYNNEIPFERRPGPGLHDTAEELASEQEAKQIAAASGQKRTFTLTKEAIELAERKKDVQKQKARTEQGFLPAALEKKLKEQQAARRLPLNLPAPQIGDSELEQIAKLGYASEAARMAAEENATPASSTLRASSVAMTPLSVRRGVLMGNATPLSTTASSTSTMAAGRTPIRDHLGINAVTATSTLFSEHMDAPSLTHSVMKRQLREALNSLPAPKNDFDIIVPEE